MYLAVFDVLNLRIAGNQRCSNIGIINCATHRRIGDLVADSAAGLEAIGKAAAPEVCLIKINAAAVLHNIAAYGSDITDLRRSCQRCRLRYSGAAFIHQLE